MRFSIYYFPILEIVKSGNNIKLSINFGLIKLLKSFIYKRYRVSVFNYNSVKSFIVNIELDTSSQLLGKKDRGSYQGHTGINKPFIKVFINILFYNQKFIFKYQVGSFIKQYFSLFNIDSIIIKLYRGSVSTPFYKYILIKL